MPTVTSSTVAATDNAGTTEVDTKRNDAFGERVVGMLSEASLSIKGV